MSETTPQARFHLFPLVALTSAVVVLGWLAWSEFRYHGLNQRLSDTQQRLTQVEDELSRAEQFEVVTQSGELDTQGPDFVPRHGHITFTTPYASMPTVWVELHLPKLDGVASPPDVEKRWQGEREFALRETTKAYRIGATPDGFYWVTDRTVFQNFGVSVTKDSDIVKMGARYRWTARGLVNVKDKR